MSISAATPFETVVLCQRCKGTGRKFFRTCPRCKGYGSVRVITENLEMYWPGKDKIVKKGAVST
jgi:DnaJ-class molecular chaperone